MPHPFRCPIVQIHMSQYHFFIRNGVEIDTKAMVLTGDLHFLVRHTENRMIPSVMAEFEFKCFSAEGKTENLMPEADPEDREFPHKAAHRFNPIRNRFGVPRPVGEEEAVRFMRQDLLRRRESRQYSDPTSGFRKLP